MENTEDEDTNGKRMVITSPASLLVYGINKGSKEPPIVLRLVGKSINLHRKLKAMTCFGPPDQSLNRLFHLFLCFTEYDHRQRYLLPHDHMKRSWRNDQYTSIHMNKVNEFLH